MSVCENCHTFKVFGEKCHYHWNDKKKCSQFRKSAEDEPHFEELIQIT